MKEIVKRIEDAIWREISDNERKLWRERYGTPHPLDKPAKPRKPEPAN